MSDYETDLDLEMEPNTNARTAKLLGFQLITAASRNQVELVIDLLDRGANVNVSNGNLLYTALEHSDDVSEGSLVQVVSDAMFGQQASKKIEVLRGLGYTNNEIVYIARSTFNKDTASIPHDVSLPDLNS